MERRNSVRVGTDVGVECRMPATPQEAILRNLSLDGCRIEIGRSSAREGTTVVLDLNRWTSVSGTIVWSNGNLAGIRFDEPLDLARYGIVDWIESTEPGLSVQLTINPVRNSAAA
jgi:hypothetical protein